MRLQVFMRYRHFRDEKRAVIEVCPVTEEEKNRCSAVMRAGGLKISTVPALILEGEPVPGLEYRFAQIIAEQNLRLIFCVTQTLADKWVALIGFESDGDAEKAALSLLLMDLGIPVIQKDPNTTLNAITDRVSTTNKGL
jgi:hypothetical protein